MAKKKLYSLNALSTECGRNFRTLSRALSDVRPDGKSADGKPRWYLSTAISALEQRERETGRVQHRHVPERFDPIVEQWITEIETTGTGLDAFLVRLRTEHSVERRREMVEGGDAKVVGRYGRALEQTVTGPDAFLRRAFVDQQMDFVTGEILRLCEWKIEQPEAQ